MSDLKTWTCDSCSGTYTGKPGDLVKEGWMQKGNAGHPFLMCADCLAFYAPTWARADKKAA